jgi:hypothetical protein
MSCQSGRDKLIRKLLKKKQQNFNAYVPYSKYSFLDECIFVFL